MPALRRVLPGVNTMSSVGSGGDEEELAVDLDSIAWGLDLGLVDYFVFPSNNRLFLAIPLQKHEEPAQTQETTSAACPGSHARSYTSTCSEAGMSVRCQHCV